LFAEADTLIEVRLDPHYRVLHWTPEYAAEAAALVPDTRSRLMLQEGRAAEAETLLVHALAAVTEPDVCGATFLIANTRLSQPMPRQARWRGSRRSVSGCCPMHGDMACGSRELLDD